LASEKAPIILRFARWRAGVPDVAKLSSNVLLALALLITVTFAGQAILAVLSKELRLDITIDFRNLNFGVRQQLDPDRARELRLTAAADRISDLTGGISAIAAATADALERTTEVWLTMVCEGAVAALACESHVTYRVAIWTDDETDRENLRRLVQHGFNRLKTVTLPRDRTLAGEVVRTGKDHYCADVTDCAGYIPRDLQPGHKCMYAIPLGTPENPWAAMTVDADQIDALDESQRAIVQWFGEVASAGARTADDVRAAVTTRAAVTEPVADPSHHSNGPDV
jgi:hypothetical protein